jgi:hypothetical protein
MNDDTSAKLIKWPSLGGQRISPKDGASPYTIMRGSLRDCVDTLRSKPESSHHLYEIRTGGTVMSAAEAMTLIREHGPQDDDKI